MWIGPILMFTYSHTHHRSPLYKLDYTHTHTHYLYPPPPLCIYHISQVNPVCGLDPYEATGKLEQGLRPAYSAEHPGLVMELVDIMWDTDPKYRPSMVTVCEVLDALFEKASERAQPSDQFNILIYSRMHVFRKLKASGQANYSRRSKDFVKKHGDDDAPPGGADNNNGGGGGGFELISELDEDVAGIAVLIPPERVLAPMTSSSPPPTSTPHKHCDDYQDDFDQTDNDNNKSPSTDKDKDHNNDKTSPKKTANDKGSDKRSAWRASAAMTRASFMKDPDAIKSYDFVASGSPSRSKNSSMDKSPVGTWMYMQMDGGWAGGWADGWWIDRWWWICRWMVDIDSSVL